jgi:DNA-binding Xre family transcriptional regulator
MALNFKKALDKALEAKQISIKKLAAEIDMTEQGFYKMLKNDSVKVATLERIAEVLELPITFFFDYETKVTGDTNQSGSGNVQVAHSKNRDINTASTHTPSKSTDNVITELEVCKKEVEYLKRENDLLRSMLDRKA